MKKLWSRRTTSEKVLCIARTAVSLVIFCSAVLKFLDLWEYGLNLGIPLFAVYYLLETVCNWKTNRDVAAFSLFMAVIIAAVSFAVFFL